MRHTFQAEQFLPHPIERVFAFFADPANLPRLMPSWQRARIDAAVFVPPPPPPHTFPGAENLTAGSGTQLKITLRALPGLPFRIPWHARIEDFRWLEGFCDVQTRGPFAYWRHCHSIQPSAGGTLLTDTVTYEPPLGPLGTFANTLFVRHQLAATFRYRQRRTLELLAAGS